METYKIELGGSFDADNSEADKFVTMQYRFKPDSVKNRDGVAKLSDHGEVEIEYSLEDQSGGSSGSSSGGAVVKLRGAGSQKDDGDGFTECLLVVDRSCDPPVARLELVATRVTGLAHDRGDQFSYENSALQGAHRGLSKRVAVDSAAAAVCKRRAVRSANKADRAAAARLDEVIATSDDAGVRQLRRKAAEALKTQAEQQEAAPAPAQNGADVASA
jgi:hypothetical protein